MITAYEGERIAQDNTELINVYVPEAHLMNQDEAEELATQLDIEAAANFVLSIPLPYEKVDYRHVCEHAQLLCSSGGDPSEVLAETKRFLGHMLNFD